MEYDITSVLPSISIDDGILRHCSLVAFAESSDYFNGPQMVDNGTFMRCSLVALAEVLDQFSGIEHYSSTAVGLHLQKLWIALAESSVMMTSERHFGLPNGVKLDLELRSQQPCGAKLTLERRFGSPGGVQLALERRFDRPWQQKELRRSEASGGNFV